MSAYFELPVIPTVFGFDPRMQFVHEEDGLAAIQLAALGRHPGTFNVAGDGVLLLSQAIHRAGRLGLPLPSVLVSSAGGAVRRARLVDFSPEQVRFLTYGRVVDTTRMRERLGFVPAYSTAATFDDFARARLPGGLRTETVQSVERGLVGLLTLGRSDG